MDAFLGLLKANLNQDEYSGYLKGSVALNALNINSGINNGCAFFAKQYLEELMSLSCERAETHKTAENTEKAAKASVNKPDKSLAANEATRTAKAEGYRAGIDPAVVKRLYIEQNLPAKECCERLGVSVSTFRRILEDNKLIKQPKRNMPPAYRKSSAKNDPALDKAAREAARDILGG